MSWLRAITVLFVFLAAFGRPASASAFVAGAPASSEARVSASELVALANVGASAETSPGLHKGIGEAYDENASGYRFAARAGAGAINVGEKGLAHVLARHFPGGAQAAGKSLFNAGEAVPGLVRAAEGVTPVLQRGGNFQRVVDAGRAVGIDRATGSATNIYTVITDAAGNLVTTFPGVP